MSHILVTGGTGFIGSHSCVKLVESKYKITIIDSLINSSIKSVDKIKILLNKKNIDFEDSLKFIKGDIRDKLFLESIFSDANSKGNNFEAVVHFAGLKSISESIKFPSKYWETNVVGTINLIKTMEKYNCYRLVFSSSASVYDLNKSNFYDEKSEIKPNTPYGSTKASIENLLNNIYNSNVGKWKIACLRYFNPIGAHPTGIIGEDPISPHNNNIFPLINKVALGKIKVIKIFGNDLPTHDGTPVRDYVHVMDIADGHSKVLQFLENNESQILFLNLGTGTGSSVLDLIKTFQEVNNIKIPYVFAERREGDSPVLVAKNNLATSLLNWYPSKDLSQMCIDGWKWQTINPNGYR